MSYNATNDYDYNYESETQVNIAFPNHIRRLYITMYFITCTLGMILNTYVIIAGYRAYYKFQKPATGVWILALAKTHLVFSLFLVLQLHYAWLYFNWHHGTVLCKLSSYVTYFSMFSTAVLLSLWSVSSRCMEGTKSGNRGTAMVLVMVLSSWMFGAVISIPSLLFRNLRLTDMGQQCIDDYGHTASDGVDEKTAIAISRFLLGVLVPVLIIIGNACLAGPPEGNLKRSCKRIICAVKVGYFVCWVPVLSLGLIQVTVGVSLTNALPVATVLAAAHCVINPVIYLVGGFKINMDWMEQEPSKADCENAHSK